MVQLAVAVGRRHDPRRATASVALGRAGRSAPPRSCRDLATLAGGRPGAVDHQGGPGPPRLPGRATRPSWSTTRSSTRAPRRTPGRRPRRSAGRRYPGGRRRRAQPAAARRDQPRRRRLLGATRPRLRGRAVPALGRENQLVAAKKGGLPPTPSALYDDPAHQEGLPVRRPAARAARRRRAAAGHARLQRHLAGHPADAAPAARHRSRDRRSRSCAATLDEAARRRRSSDGGGRRRADGAPQRPAPQELTDRARAERRLGWLLCAPAVLVMLAVTGYPIVLRRLAVAAALRPALPRRAASSSGSTTTCTVLTLEPWWQDVWSHADHHRRLGGASSWCSACCSRSSCTARSSAAAPVRAAILIPYGIVTVVAAFAWRFAFDPDDRLRQRPALSNDDRPADRPLRLARRDHPHRGLEDDAVHGAAAARRADARARRAARGGPGRRRHAVQRFFRITLPLMKPAILVALLFRTLDAFRIFDSCSSRPGAPTAPRRCRSSATTR